MRIPIGFLPLSLAIILVPLGAYAQDNDVQTKATGSSVVDVAGERRTFISGTLAMGAIWRERRGGGFIFRGGRVSRRLHQRDIRRDRGQRSARRRLVAWLSLH